MEPKINKERKEPYFDLYLYSASTFVAYNKKTTTKQNLFECILIEIHYGILK